MPDKEKLTALVTLIVPEGQDPRAYVQRVLHPTVQYHFTMTDESQALTIEQQKRTIESLETKVQQQLLSRKYGTDDAEYIVRLHKDDSLRRSGRASYSPLAWELAHYAKLSGGEFEGYPVRAELPTFTLLAPVVGHGNTTTEAMQAVARELDRIAEG